MKIGIIGSGIGGLAAAIRLRAKGHNVEVFEANKSYGGKLGELNINGFRFDTGPSLFTLPELVDELTTFSKTAKHVEYHKLEVVCRYFWENGTTIDSFSNPEKFAIELEKKVGEDSANTMKFLEYASKLYKLTANIFIFRSLSKLNTWLSSHIFRNANLVIHLKPYKTMSKVIEKNFKTAEARQLFMRLATYNGSSPYLAPSTLNVIAHLEHSLGAYFPEKGMRTIADTLFNIAVELGVKFHFNKPVTELIIEKGKVSALKSYDQMHQFEAVISDIDIYNFYGKIKHGLKIPRKVEKAELSSSALIFYWGINRSFENLELHNILFSSDYKNEFDALFKTKTLFNDPTVYIFISSKKVDSDAPAGKENWFVMINVPSNKILDDESVLRDARKNIISKINRVLKIDIDKYIEFESVTTPTGIEKSTGSTLGALYGASSNTMMSAFNRHSNFRSKIGGLYFVGGSVHPGGGIPLCLAAAKIVDEIIG